MHSHIYDDKAIIILSLHNNIKPLLAVRYLGINDLRATLSKNKNKNKFKILFYLQFSVVVL